MNNKQIDNNMKRITEAKHVTKRDGKLEKIELSKIEQRLNYLCSDEERDLISICSIAVDASQSIYDKIFTIELDNVCAQICASRASKHPFYNDLGGRILITNLHKETLNTFSDKIKAIHANDKTYLKPSFVKYIKNNAHILDTFMDYSRDLNIDYFAYMTLQKSYLVKIHDKIVERPQDMYMKVAIALHHEDVVPNEEILANIKKSYDYMTLGYFTHATPTLFNAGLRSGNLASCFLLYILDSLKDHFKVLGDSGEISKYAGGIGIAFSEVRAKNSFIKSTKGITSGIVPLLKLFNDTARYVNQSGRRNGSIAAYLEPWHADVLDFLELRLPDGIEELRTRDLFLALWIPDRFMQAVENKENWYLMSPDDCPGLIDAYGEDFNKLYNSYVEQKKFREAIPAETLWKKILKSQFETGMPYILFKDTINKHSNQKNIGTVKSSNLCSEITEVTGPDRYSVCNLASIAVNKFVENNKYNYTKLHEVVKHIVYNINRVIDITYYPTPECKKTNLSDRPMGIGIQGVADLFHIMKLSYSSSEAIELEQNILETMYHACLETSNELAKKYGKYTLFDGSDLSKGIFHFDYYNIKPRIYSDWDDLKKNIMESGVRNSLMIALMPTASTSQILGNNECFEPMTSNIYTRRTSAGEFILVNKHLIKELNTLGIWSEEMREQLIINNGSVQNIKELTEDIKERYKTVWEIKMKDVINHAIARQAYVDQSQSMNLFMPVNDANKLTSALIYGWKNGLKTGMYYLRTLPAAQAQKFSIDASKLTPVATPNDKLKPKIKVFEADDVCINCSS
jgi:ribonucleoside-diphosphate reductase alpha chain